MNASQKNNRSARGQGAIRPGSGMLLRQRLSWLLVYAQLALAVAAVVGLGWGVSSGYRYLDAPVEVIAIKGDYSNVTQQELARWVEPLLNGGMISLDLGALRASVKTHPWIAEASISRAWPNGILIEIQEELPVARWGASGFLNSRGEALQIDDNSGLQQLPMLSGPEGWEQQVMHRYRELAALLLAANLQIDDLVMNQRGAWRVSLLNAPELVLGRDDLEQKIQRFLVVWERGLSERAARVAQVDLRYDNGVAVRWHPAKEISGAWNTEAVNKNTNNKKMNNQLATVAGQPVQV